MLAEGALRPDDWVDRYRHGESIPALARQAGCSDERMRRLLKRAGAYDPWGSRIVPRPPVPEPEEAAGPALPPDDRRWVARVYFNDGTAPAVSPAAPWRYLGFWLAAVRRAHGGYVKAFIVIPDPRGAGDE